MKTYEEILKGKIDYYGKTEAAYQFAAEEFSNMNVIEQLRLREVGVTFEEKHTPNFEEFMTNFCKHGITLTNNYTRETIDLKDLIRKYKLTNNIKP